MFLLWRVWPQGLPFSVYFAIFLWCLRAFTDSDSLSVLIASAEDCSPHRPSSAAPGLRRGARGGFSPLLRANSQRRGFLMEGNMSQSTAVASRSRSRSRSPERGAGVLNQAGRSGELNGASHSTEFRAGDWQCRNCGRHVYGSREQCKCGQPKALNAAPVAQGPFAANSRPGDWLCPSCGVVVYASKALPPP